jgi:hypothetical protein
MGSAQIRSVEMSRLLEGGNRTAKRATIVPALFRLRQIQVVLNEHGKCGIEGIRPNSSKLYGGYWYNDSREEGQKRYNQVRAAVEADEVFNRTYPEPWNFDVKKHLILKRACTEFEQTLGDSSKWEITEGQRKLEHRIFEAFELDQNVYPQPRHIRAHVKCRWIHHAFQWGDPTYKELTDGEQLFQSLKTYHTETEERSDGEERESESELGAHDNRGVFPITPTKYAVPNL